MTKQSNMNVEYLNRYQDLAHLWNRIGLNWPEREEMLWLEEMIEELRADLKVN